MKPRLFLRLTLLVLASAVSACTVQRGFSGSAPSGEKLATIQVHGARLRSVNGVDILPTTSTVKVRPGKNDIYLTVSPSNFNARGPDDTAYRLLLQAEAGTDYIVTGRRGDGRLCAWPVSEHAAAPDFTKHAGCIVRIDAPEKSVR